VTVRFEIRVAAPAGSGAGPPAVTAITTATNGSTTPTGDKDGAVETCHHSGAHGSVDTLTQEIRPGARCGGGTPVPAQANRVAAVLDDLGLRRVAVAGHSSGGYVGTALAEQRPDLVGSLALISTGPSLDALLPQPVILRVLRPRRSARSSGRYGRMPGSAKGPARRPLARWTSRTTWSPRYVASSTAQ
jgi:pimeloyl-ACP methyl ester carboxylesterase